MPVRQDLALCFDLECTGSDQTEPNARILEFGGVLVSVPDLEVVDDFKIVTYFHPERIHLLDPVVQEMHTANGLWKDCARSLYDEEGAQSSIIDWLSEYSKKSDLIPMMGSGVAHYDGKWIQARMPDLRKRLTYWAFDVGSVRRFLTMIAKVEIPQIDNKPGEEHRALPDAYRALEEAKAYRRLMVNEEFLHSFVDPNKCRFDHHGGCQEHGYISLQPGERCPQAELQERLGVAA